MPRRNVKNEKKGFNSIVSREERPRGPMYVERYPWDRVMFLAGEGVLGSSVWNGVYLYSYDVPSLCRTRESKHAFAGTTNILQIYIFHVLGYY